MRNTYLKAVVTGVIAGMRTMSAPAFVSDRLARENSVELAASSFGFMGDPRVARALKIAAIGEFAADKLPFMPDRISPGPLAARVVSGALCGASLCKADGKRVDVGAIAGGLSAIGAAYAFYYIRRELAKTTPIPDTVLALGEDAIVVAAGLSVLSHNKVNALASPVS